MIKFSILIATYNSGKTLKQTLDSIRYQSYTKFEVIIIDNVSTDNTLDIVKEYADIVTRCISEKDTGLYSALNKGLNLATGDFVYVLGSDDCLHDYGVLKKIADILAENAIDVLSNPVIFVDREGIERDFTNEYSREEILSGRMLPHQGLFVALKIMQHYRFNEQNKIISDYEFLLRYVLDGGKISFTHINVAYFSGSGMSSGCVPGDKMWNLMLKEYLSLYQHVPLDFQYELNFLKTSFGFHDDSLIYPLKEFLIELLKRVKLFHYVQILRGKEQRHQCDLKYCRWCKRGT